MCDGAGAAMVPWFRFTGRRQGDLAPSAAGVEERRRAVVPLPWTWLRQGHGADVVVVERPGAQAGVWADAAVTATPGAAVCVTVADCAPVVLIGQRAVGVVHAGWRGLVAGVLPAAVASLDRLGAGSLRAVVGPCIEPACYEFGPDDLDLVADVLGPTVVARTSQGTPALDLVAGVRTALARAGVTRCDAVGTCTACSDEHWSHRGTGARARQALVAGLAP